MKLSEIGQLAENFLLEIPDRYQYAILDEYIVMPNHIHVIITINKTNDGRIDDRVIVGNDDARLFCRDAINRVSTKQPGVVTKQPNVPTTTPNVPTTTPNAPTKPQNDPTTQQNDPTTQQNVPPPPTEQSMDSIINPQQKNVGGITGNKNPMLHDTISRIMNWHTGRVTFESRKINKLYRWQARFHDQIIRDSEKYQRIKDYIQNNPKNWISDTFNKPF